MLGVFLDLDSLTRGDLDLTALESVLPEWQFYGQTDPDELKQRLAEATVVVSNKVPILAEHLLQAKKIRLICVSATGTDNIDIEAASARDIGVCNVRGYATASVTQHVFSLILALTTRLPDYCQAVRSGQWENSKHFCMLDYPIAELAGKTMGIIGYGALGKAVADIARAFGMQIIIAARPGTSVCEGRTALKELLPQVDILSIHCPLAANTRGLIGEHELASMKSGALLINTARGGIVDEGALANFLREGHLGGAGIDVLSIEPPQDGNPLLVPDIPNLIVTPHIAWASLESRQRLVSDVASNIHAWLSGQARNLVNS